MNRMGFGAVTGAWLAAGILAWSTAAMGASRTISFEEPEFGTPDAGCDPLPKMPMFNRPKFSGSTALHIDGTNACGEGALGGTNGNDSLLTAAYSVSPANSAELRFSWLDTANDSSWARVTTSGAGAFANPGVYTGVGGKISMRIAVYGLDGAGAESTAGALEFVPLIRESGSLVPLGNDSGTTGTTIEFLGIDSKTGSTPVGGARIGHSATREFHLVEWEILSESEVAVSIDGVTVNKLVLSFNLGNGKLDPPMSRGTLEALGIRKPEDDDVTKKWFVNIDDVTFSAPGITDPVAIKTPVLWTDTTVTVINVNAEADELRLYKNGELYLTAVPPFSGAAEHGFNPVALAIGDVLTATQVIDGIESAHSYVVNVLPPGLRVAIGVRELASVTDPVVGGNGGAAGGLELVGENITTSGAPGGQLVRMEPCWQTVTIDPNSPTLKVRNFASGNGALNSAAAPWYVLEHIAFSIDSANPFSGPFTIYIDNMENAGVVFGAFDTYTAPTANATVMFRQPTFSGSTGANVMATPNISQVVDEHSESGANALKVSFQFVDSGPSRWLRLTTNNVTNQGNPLIRLDAPLHFRILIVPTTGIGAGPTITDQPDAAEAILGGGATFHVAATGIGTLHYQWLLDGAPVGTDSDTLSLQGLQLTDSGIVSVTVCDDTGYVHSEEVALTVLECPRPFADADRDGDVDQADFGRFQACISGTAPLDADQCTCFNVPMPDGAGGYLPADGDVDLDDLVEFMKCATGPGIPFVAGDMPDCEKWLE